MAIATESFGEIYNQYSDAIDWMNSLSIKLDPGRTAHYERVVGHWKDTYTTASEDEGRETFPNFVNSMFEIHDFIDIHKAFKDVPVNQLTSIIDKLNKAVNGPINSSDETPKSTSARNFLFEAVLAAKMHRPNAQMVTILDAESDTGVKFNNKKIWVECKRVTNTDKIESNVRKASSQLENIIKKKVGSSHRGLVALEISKTIHSGDKIFVKNNDTELISSIDLFMDNFVQQNSNLWEKVYKRRNKKIIGTIIRFSFMSSSESRSLLVHTSQWALNPRQLITFSDDKVLKQLAEVLKYVP